MMMPIVSTYDDQSKRIRQWTNCLGYTHDPENPEASVIWAVELLANRKRWIPLKLGVSGTASAEQLVEAFAT